MQPQKQMPQQKQQKKQKLRQRGHCKSRKSKRRSRELAAEEEYKAIADEVKAEAAKAPDYTFKRQGEEIFRREMGEPEFWLEKEDRFPRPIFC